MSIKYITVKGNLLASQKKIKNLFAQATNKLRNKEA